MTTATVIWAIVAIISFILFLSALAMCSEKDDEIKYMNEQLNKQKLENHDLYTQLLISEKTNAVLMIKNKLSNKSNKE